MSCARRLAVRPRAAERASATKDDACAPHVDVGDDAARTKLCRDTTSSRRRRIDGVHVDIRSHYEGVTNVDCRAGKHALAAGSSNRRHERDGRRHQQRSGDAPHCCCVDGVLTALTPLTTGHEPQSSPEICVRHNFELELLINLRILVESTWRAALELG